MINLLDKYISTYQFDIKQLQEKFMRDFYDQVSRRHKYIPQIPVINIVIEYDKQERRYIIKALDTKGHTIQYASIPHNSVKEIENYLDLLKTRLLMYALTYSAHKPKK